MQLELKKGKWSKRYLELKDGVVTHAKSEKVSQAADGLFHCVAVLD